MSFQEPSDRFHFRESTNPLMGTDTEWRQTWYQGKAEPQKSYLSTTTTSSSTNTVYAGCCKNAFSRLEKMQFREWVACFKKSLNAVQSFAAGVLILLCSKKCKKIKNKSFKWATHHGGRISPQPKLPRQNRKHRHVAQTNSRQTLHVLYYWSSIRYVFTTSYRRAILFEISENKQSISLIRFAASIGAFSIKNGFAAKVGCML